MHLFPRDKYKYDDWISAFDSCLTVSYMSLVMSFHVSVFIVGFKVSFWLLSKSLLSCIKETHLSLGSIPQIYGDCSHSCEWNDIPDLKRQSRWGVFVAKSQEFDDFLHWDSMRKTRPWILMPSFIDSFLFFFDLIQCLWIPKSIWR